MPAEPWDSSNSHAKDKQTNKSKAPPPVDPAGFKTQGEWEMGPPHGCSQQGRVGCQQKVISETPSLVHVGQWHQPPGPAAGQSSLHRQAARCHRPPEGLGGGKQQVIRLRTGPTLHTQEAPRAAGQEGSFADSSCAVLSGGSGADGKSPEGRHEVHLPPLPMTDTGSAEPRALREHRAESPSGQVWMRGGHQGTCDTRKDM